MLLGSDPPADQVVPHSVGKSKVVIPSGCHISVLNQGEVEVSVEILLQLRYIFNASEASHRNLFLSLVVRQGFRHVASSSGSLTLEECKQYGQQAHTTGHTDTAGEAPTTTDSGSGSAF